MYRLKKRAQATIEYAVLIGFVTLLTVPLLIIYHETSIDSKRDLVSSQVFNIAQKIGNTAESVYFLGEPSQVKLKIKVPSDVINYTLADGVIIYTILIADAPQDVIRPVNVNMSGSLPTQAGLYEVLVEAKTNFVNVSYT